jgi:hypothetical protein
VGLPPISATTPSTLPSSTIISFTGVSMRMSTPAASEALSIRPCNAAPAVV